MIMTNFSGKLNLIKLKNACVLSVNGKTGSKKGVFIPIEDNNIFVSTDENNKARCAYLDFSVFENRQASRYGDTHMIKPRVGKEIRAQMSEEDKRAIPIIGNMRPLDSQSPSVPQNDIVTPASPAAPQDNDDSDLPFNV